LSEIAIKPQPANRGNTFYRLRKLWRVSAIAF
jgi:hypothetical protein